MAYLISYLIGFAMMLVLAIILGRHTRNKHDSLLTEAAADITLALIWPAFAIVVVFWWVRGGIRYVIREARDARPNDR